MEGDFGKKTMKSFGVSATPVRQHRGSREDEMYAMNPKSVSFIAQRGGLRRNRERKRTNEKISEDAELSNVPVPIVSGGGADHTELTGEKIKRIRHEKQDSNRMSNLSRFRQTMRASQGISAGTSAPSDFLGLGGKGTCC